MDYPIDPEQQLLRLKEVMIRTGIKKSVLYERIKKGTFPPGVDIGGGYRRWRASDIDDWIAALPEFDADQQDATVKGRAAR